MTNEQRALDRDFRAAEYRAARAALDTGTGVLLEGPPGAGRTTFVKTLIPQLDESTRSRLWVSDGLPALENDGAQRFSKAVTSGEIVPLITSTSHRHRPEAIFRLLQDGHLVRIELPSTPARGLLALAQGILGGPLDSAAATTFVPARGGSDLASLRLALEEARSKGMLIQRDGVWRLVTTPQPSELLRHLLQAHSGSTERSPLTSTLLDIVALTPELSWASLIELTTELRLEEDPIAELERLEELGVFEILDEAGRPKLRYRDGLIELLLPQTIPVLRRRRLTSATTIVLGRVAPAELSAGELVASARHSLALGLTIDPETLTRAATTSLRYPDALLSLRLARAAVEQNGGFDAEMALAAIEAQTGRPDDALDRLRRLVAEAEGDLQFSEALRAMTQQVLHRASDPETLTDLELDAGALLGVTSPRLDALKGFMLFTLGDSIGAARLIEPALPEFTGETLGQAQVAVATAAFLTGRLSLASSSLDAAEAAFDTTGADASSVHVLRANVNVYRGRISESIAVVEQFRDAATAYGRPAAQALCRWALGAVLISAGRATEAVDELRQAVETMEQLGLSDGPGRTARTDLAVALALTGDSTAAAGVLEGTTAPPPGQGVGKLLHAEGWVAAAAGDHDRAAAAFLRSADAYGAQGLYLACLHSLGDAARVRSATIVLPRVDALADIVEGEYADLTVRYSRALARSEALPPGDLPEVRLLAEEFDEVGEAATSIEVHLIAAEAFAHASHLHAVATSPRKAAASNRRLGERMAACGLEHLPLSLDVQIDRLSERESEIAGLAASGLTNREIAAELVLSVRTVETHLQRVYEKLGVRGRSELVNGRPR
ncbi:LuxR C-terminal-related transcriptional regulator [Herbiconiux sp. P17]|uniref:helix-turn-helix transcriptional regulator n=1 Tax=Herbiconiux wuyangfengii TaxID=3342794 RepID=UPI0035BAD378